MQNIFGISLTSAASENLAAFIKENKMNTDKAIEMLKRQPANAEAALKIETEKSEMLLEKVIEYRKNLSKENPNWSDVGEAKRFNALLDEVVEIYQYQR